MAHTTVPVPANQWTQVNSTAITALSFQVKGSNPVELQITTTDTEPSSRDGAWVINPLEREFNVTLANMAPGVTTPSYVWAWADDASTLTFSHA